MGKYNIMLNEKRRMQKHAYIMTLIMHINLVIYFLFVSQEVLKYWKQHGWTHLHIIPLPPPRGNLKQVFENMDGCLWVVRFWVFSIFFLINIFIIKRKGPEKSPNNSWSVLGTWPASVPSCCPHRKGGWPRTFLAVEACGAVCLGSGAAVGPGDLITLLQGRRTSTIPRFSQGSCQVWP